MATALSLSFSSDLKPHRHLPRHHHHHLRQPPIHFHPFTSKHTHPYPLFPKPTRSNLLFTSSTLQDPLSTGPGPGPFLSTGDLENLQTLNNFKYLHKLPSGYVLIRLMQEQELDMIVGLLAESFADAMLVPKAYVKFLGFLVKQYLVERRSLMPHTATLIGYFTDDVVEDGKELDVKLAGTVEVNFDKRGASSSPPTPTPPRDCPYICNMTVTESLRRRGIGWHLLKASEELISKMSSSREVYLHCRMIDTAPLNMYTKAGYNIVKTDNILILLTLQRRKHLMRKQLPPESNSLSDTEVSYSDEELPSEGIPS